LKKKESLPSLAMNIEVDQSGKIGETGRKTVLAFSDEISFALIIPSRVKRECIRWLRRREGFKAHSYLRIFAAGLFLLFRDYLDQLDVITIDIEYPGHEDTIRGMLLDYIWNLDPGFPKENIGFAQIGKKSKAHERACRVFQEEIPPDRVVKAKELQALLR